MLNYIFSTVSRTKVIIRFMSIRFCMQLKMRNSRERRKLDRQMVDVFETK